MVAAGLQPDLRSYSIAMNAMCEVGDVDGAREVLEALLASGVSPDMRVYSTLAKGRGVFPGFRGLRIELDAFFFCATFRSLFSPDFS
jgi:pentatricopeptide repeat protein